MGELFFSVIMKNKEEIKENILLYLFTVSHRLIRRKEKDSMDLERRDCFDKISKEDPRKRCRSIH